MTATQRIFACVFAGLLWLAAIVGKHFWPDLDTGAFVLACASVITALGVHGAATGSALGPFVAGDTVVAPTSGQGGFARLSLLVMLVGLAVGVSLLAGCSTTMAAYESAAYNEIKAANDNKLQVLTVAYCGQPLSTFLRNPSSIAAAKAMCLPMAGGSDPANILDGKQAITVNVVIPAAAASAAK